MPKRRNDDHGLLARAAAFGAALLVRTCAKAARRPVDSFAILAAVAASIVIVVNAVYLQSGAHPAPFFANTSPPAPLPSAAGATADIRPKAAEPASPNRSGEAAPAPQAIAMRRTDPITELIGPSPRILAVQHVLSDYGYGQIKPSGMLDQATSAAIEKFEREHKMPITGRVSDRLVSDLASMIGHPLQ